jgi:hypothetical protein
MTMDANGDAKNSSTNSLADDPKWRLVQRIVASSGFVNSKRLSEFLLYVTRRSLAGEGESLNERTIGEAVFDRVHDYDPRDDNIVRSHASRLRQRLLEYFEAEGAPEEWHVTIPRGSYVPVFGIFHADLKPATPQIQPLESMLSGHDADQIPSSSNLRRGSLNSRVVLILLLAAVIVAASIYAFHRYRMLIEQTVSHKLWSQMFQPDRQTLIVPADSSLVITRLLVGHQVPLADYAGGRYRQATACDKPCDLSMINTIEGLRYTSMSDLEYAVKVSHLPEAIPSRLEIRYARDLELKDLKESNLILAGSQEADPWMAAISPQMNFVVHDDPSLGPLHVENRHPRKGEQSDYPYDFYDPQHRGLATIAFLPNLSGRGNLLIVQGFSLAGTQAAAEFVTSGRDLDALFPAYSGNSTRLPHFEVLLATVEINGMASRPTPLAWHILP